MCVMWLWSSQFYTKGVYWPKPVKMSLLVEKQSRENSLVVSGEHSAEVKAEGGTALAA